MMPLLGLAPLVGIGPMGPIELVLILAVVIIIFGVGRLPEVGGAIGKGIREFRKASKEDDEPKQITQAQSTEQPAPPVQSPPVQQQTPAVVCAKCGTANAPDTRFCGQCGAALEARV
ncbi:MAG TPA: twin-arginine translocase TatA/TatE family subunit [Dehalococcoidia bacterium]|nr:twin-arginine translocase TatA/TatE family subunit [Dehalococcoidia bacterium]